MTLKTPPPLSEERSVWVTPAQVAVIVRNAVQAESCGGPVPFEVTEVTVEGTQEAATVFGKTRTPLPRDAFEEAEQSATWGE